jgi:hypothetical protein
MRFNHRENLLPKAAMPKLTVDEITEQPLSSLLSELRMIFKRYQSNVKIAISEKGGRPYEIELNVRIQL